MQDYYNRRAGEYEAIYHRDDPARQLELGAITTAMRAALAGHDVLEIACGTGYWTERLAPFAQSVLATDASQEMLDVARSKQLPATARFTHADAYDLSAVQGDFDGGLANFWFSHVPHNRVTDFLNGLHRRLGSGASVFMADNCFQEGVGGELVQMPGGTDTFKRRYLSDGSEHLILKNYYTHEQLSSLFESYTRNLKVHVGHYYWWLSYDVA
jgi:ubiquinone/menaquinone biosynthesis C-methylase UbiE